MRLSIFDRKYISGLLIGLAILIAPAAAQAGAAPLQISSCAPGYQTWDFTAKVVYCIDNAVRNASDNILATMCGFMAETVAAMMVLAIAFFGFRIVGGEREIVPKAIALLLRLGLVYMFCVASTDLHGFSRMPYQVMESLIDLVVGDRPWARIDGFLGKMLGFGPPPMNVDKGLIGIIGGALLSSTAGVFLFIAGVAAILNLLLFIFRIVFIYLTAVTLIGFLISIAPLLVPTAIFFMTERYFTKWIHMLIYAMITPMMLFAFLIMFINIFDNLIGNIFYILNPNGGVPNFSAYWKVNQPLFAWLMPADPHYTNELTRVVGATQASAPAVQSNITPQLRLASNAGIFNFAGIDFGPNNVQIVQKLTLAFVTLWLFTSLMKSMLHKIPALCNNLAAVSSSMISTQPTRTEGEAKNFISGAQQKLTSALKGGG